jgi:hypothetical protein
MSGPDYDIEIKPGAVRGHTFECSAASLADACFRTRRQRLHSREDAEAEAKEMARADRSGYKRKAAGRGTVRLRPRLDDSSPTRQGKYRPGLPLDHEPAPAAQLNHFSWAHVYLND